MSSEQAGLIHCFSFPFVEKGSRGVEGLVGVIYRGIASVQDGVWH